MTRHGEGIRADDAMLVTLSFATGATDAFAFLALGGVFTANLTGNLILITLASRAHYLQTLAGATTAIAAFALSLWVSFRFTRRSPHGPAATRVQVAEILGGAVILQALTLALGVAAVDHWLGVAPYLVIATSAAAMAAQTVAAKRAGAGHNISTTYVTGTLTGLMQDIAEGRPGGRALRLAVIVSLPLGALISAGVMQFHPIGGAAVAFLAAVAGLVFAWHGSGALARR